MQKLTENELTRLIMESNKNRVFTYAQERAYLSIWWYLPAEKYRKNQPVSLSEIEQSIEKLQAYKTRSNLTLTEQRIFDAWIKKAEKQIEKWRN